VRAARSARLRTIRRRLSGAPSSGRRLRAIKHVSFSRNAETPEGRGAITRNAPHCPSIDPSTVIVFFFFSEKRRSPPDCRLTSYAQRTSRLRESARTEKSFPDPKCSFDDRCSFSFSLFRSANIIYVAVYNLDEHSGFRGQERKDQSVLTLSRFAHSCHSDRPSALSSAGYGQRDLQVPSQARRHVRYARFIERHFQMTVTRTRCDIASLRPHNDIIPRQVRQRSDSLLSARCSGHAR
jgi:hypothetical protein